MSPERIAPEQFGFENSRPTISSDCYALGMVIYETISGNIPFHKDTDLTVFLKVVKGEHPPRGVKFVRDLWEMLERCWASKPSDRPCIEDILRCLEMVSNLSEPTSPGAGGGMDADGDDQDSPTSSSGGDSVDFFATNDCVQSSPIHSPQVHYLMNLAGGSARWGHDQRITVDSMSGAPDDIPDSLPAFSHRGIPTSPPPTPCAVTQCTSSPNTDTFTSLCSEFLTMLDDTGSAMGPGAASLEEAAQVILSIFRAGKRYSVLHLAYQESLTNCGHPLGDSSAESSQSLTSPMESPPDDFLFTPGLRHDDYTSEFTSPLIADGDDFGAPFHDTPLFDDVCLFEPPSSSDVHIAPLSPQLPTGTCNNPTQGALNPGPENSLTISVDIGDDHSVSTYSPDGRTPQARTQ